MEMTEDEMVEWHHQLSGHEFEQALGVGDAQGGLAFCSPWGRKESDTTEQLNWTELNWIFIVIAWKIPLYANKGAWQPYSPWGLKELEMTEHIHKIHTEKNKIFALLMVR